MPTPSPVARVTLDGQHWDIALGDLDANDAKDFRRALGVSLSEVFSKQVAFDIDVMAGLIWLARRKNEPRLKFDDVAASVNVMSDLDIETVEEEVAADPET